MTLSRTTRADETVKVVVRCRPLNDKERNDGRKQIVSMDVAEGQVSVINPKLGPDEAPKQFTYDQVYDWNSKQFEIFSITAKPIVDSVMDGYNGTIFAYGQTGTGKTHTMEGIPTQPQLRGIMLNSFDYIFDQIQDQTGSANREYLVYITYLEIYNEEIKDLLSSSPHTQKLALKEDPNKGVYVQDLKKCVVKDATETNKYLMHGKEKRHTGATQMNADSSRSHSIFTVIVERNEDNVAGEASLRVGKLNLVDLAGSERQSKTQASGDRLTEGININLSLTALGNVIEALVASGKKHVPYRDSKLTRLLQDSLGGNTKTVMVANIGPADWNFDETLSTLRYANRAKNIKNKPKINEHPKDAMLREVQEQIAELKRQLAAKGGAGGVPGHPREKVVETDLSEERVAAIRRQIQREMQEKILKDNSAGAMNKAKQEAEAKARAQLEQLMADTNATEKQKEEAMAMLNKNQEEIAQYADSLTREMDKKAAIEKKLKKMEEKVLHGGENMVEKMSELKKTAKATKAELQIQQRQQQELERRMRELEKEDLEFEEQVGSLKEQAENMTRKLKKLYANYQAKKSERDSLQQEFQREREEILEGIREMTKDIKLKDLIIASFIPPSCQETIMNHAQWNEYEDTWVIDAMRLAGNAVRAQRDLQQAHRAHLANYDLMSAEQQHPALDDAYFTYKELEELQAQQMGVVGRAVPRPH